MSKIISVSDEVYSMLSALKKDKSYTALIREFLLKRANKEEILKFAGMGGIDEREMESLKKEWKKASKKYA